MMNYRKCKLFLCVGVLCCGTMVWLHQPAFAQDQARGTEQPVVYAEKDRILKKEQRQRRSQAIQEVAILYREMVASYKAKRIVRAEELSQKLDALLTDSVLPKVFAKKMQRKQQAFLERIYDGRDDSRMEVSVDEVSDHEVDEIKNAVEIGAEKETDANPSMVSKEALASERVEQTQQTQEIQEIQEELETQEKKEILKKERDLARQRKIEERQRKRQEKIMVKEQRRQEKIARREQRRQKILEEREERKRQKEQAQKLKDLSGNPAEVLKQDSAQAPQSKNVEKQSDNGKEKVDTKQRGAVQVHKLLDNQEKFLGMEQKEIDRYVDLYYKEMKARKEKLMKRLVEKIDTLYEDGLEFYQRKAYYFAYDIFQEVEKLEPDYKLTRQYLKELERYFSFGPNNNLPRSSSQRSKRDRVISNTLDSYRP